MAFFGSKSNNSTPVIDVASNNIIGKGTTVKGDIEATGNIRIEGNVEGNINTKAKVVFGSSAHMKGNIYAQNAEIAGKIDGILNVTETLVLKPTAIINGDVVVGSFVVEPGATFNGNCKMKEVKATTTNTPERAKQTA